MSSLEQRACFVTSQANIGKFLVDHCDISVDDPNLFLLPSIFKCPYINRYTPTNILAIQKLHIPIIKQVSEGL